MSERKKKYISYKDANKRPPVILSKHSEYNPDIDNKYKDVARKEKTHSNEKEPGQSSKQPTILIKAREDSQRPSSPKRIQMKENESSINTKTSNSGPVSDNTNHLSTSKMKNPIKIIDSNFEFNAQALDFLCDNQNDYLVVGIIGTQGVGKSTILNLIAHSNTSNLTPRILNAQLKIADSNFSKTNILTDSKTGNDIYPEYTSNDILYSPELSSDKNSLDTNEVLADNFREMKLSKVTTKSESEQKDRNEFLKFDVESDDQLQIGQHCTDGIDMYITPNRVILLDTQPLLSASVMDKMVADNKTMPTETTIELESLYVTSFILSTCHVVLLVQDWFMDPNVLRFLHTADMLKPSNPVPTISIGEESHEEHTPHIMLVHNKCTMSDFTPSSLDYITSIYEDVFLESKLLVRSGLCADALKSKEKSEKKGIPINLFLLPEVLPDYANDNIYKGHDSLDQLIRVLRQRILGASRTPIGHSVISEKHWGHFASKTWDAIKKNSFYMEYTRMLN